jgi:hypothetical protein
MGRCSNRTHEILLNALGPVVVEPSERHLRAHVALLRRVLVVVHKLLIRLCVS